jgi:hypothetical protein
MLTEKKKHFQFYFLVEKKVPGIFIAYNSGFGARF